MEDLFNKKYLRAYGRHTPGLQYLLHVLSLFKEGIFIFIEIFSELVLTSIYFSRSLFYFIWRPN